MRDSQHFFGSVRDEVFGGHLRQPQVDGLNALLAEWDAHHAPDDGRWLAYCLATAAHETALTMQPIEEYGRGIGHPYGRQDPVTRQTYYGRGYVQLTWKANYALLGAAGGRDLVNSPAEALEPHIAASILFGGMIGGSFTGAALEDFFHGEQADPFGARRIVNGTDQSVTIAKKYYAFLRALAPAVVTT